MAKRKLHRESAALIPAVADQKAFAVDDTVAIRGEVSKSGGQFDCGGDAQRLVDYAAANRGARAADGMTISDEALDEAAV